MSNRQPNDCDRQSQLEGGDQRPQGNDRDRDQAPRQPTLEDRLVETARIVERMAESLTERRRDNEKSIAKAEPFYGEGQDPEL